ncbi:NADPH:quinone oxidoreductase family protein [Ramlibacter alkalitolerans]|uniref:NADPH:quinone oxidoreductase family protein n=1 Tax=Ramlibacter alkalitolerans TaxID=2039631 RepID=A0ABS1JMA2_9BURK|nr:NADPH:quinone oxidoreductase family protein [Ramlibacter alkalitolerans]MBL0425261.1 NADPH:quinone oxidoreductase family protein [Ramlibacter alkalitolerans]
MKAVLCKQYGPPSSLVVEEVPAPMPGAGQVLIEVHAAGVNFPDTLIIQGKYQFKPELPFSPGAEVAGVVKALGEGVAGLRVGARVIAATTWGGYAQQVLAPAERVIPMPHDMDFETAAGFLIAYGTSHHALKDRGALKAGETVLVLGAAGGVGLAAVEIAKALGARVIAAASSDEKLAVCREHGADATINYATQDLRERIKALTDGRGVDVVYDPVGGDLSEPALRSMAWRGRFLVVGFAAGPIPSIPLNLALLKGCSIVGVFWGAFVRAEPRRNEEELRELVGWVREGRLHPRISGVYPLERCAEALQQVMDRKVTGKFVLTTGA